MYRPAAYAMDDLAILRDLVRTRSFATIAGAVGSEVLFAYAPVVLDAGSGPKGGVRLHLARANPLAQIGGSRVRLSFLGPDSYVSPDWYKTEGLVPTWNYIAVEGAGVARALDRPALHRLLIDLSAVHETRLAPKTPWTTDKVPEQKLEALLEAIVGFEVPFETLEGKFKLSQDKRAEDFEGVVAALEASPEPGSRAVAAAMRHVGCAKGRSG